MPLDKFKFIKRFKALLKRKQRCSGDLATVQWVRVLVIYVQQSLETSDNMV